jgi:hypothetical protein
MLFYRAKNDGRQGDENKQWRDQEESTLGVSCPISYHASV